VTAATFRTHPTSRLQFGPDFQSRSPGQFRRLACRSGPKARRSGQAGTYIEIAPALLALQSPFQNPSSRLSVRIFPESLPAAHWPSQQGVLQACNPFLMGSTAACKVAFCVPSSSTNGLGPWPRDIPREKKRSLAHPSPVSLTAYRGKRGLLLLTHAISENSGKPATTAFIWQGALEPIARKAYKTASIFTDLADQHRTGYKRTQRSKGTDKGLFTSKGSGRRVEHSM
jgi:hypothetical protein